MNLHTLLVAMSWDVQKYSTACEREGIRNGMTAVETILEGRFPCYDSETRGITTPRTVVDKYGRILTWVLPNVLPKRIQVRDECVILFYHL